jgi:hypothetical protein
VLYTLPALVPTPPEVELPPDMPIKPFGQMAYVVKLCGMFTAHLEARNPESGGIASRYGVGIMLRSREIREVLMSDELREERRGNDAIRAARADTGPRITNVVANDSVGADDEFVRFENLTRRIVNTPKTEIDEKRKADQ